MEGWQYAGFITPNRDRWIPDDADVARRRARHHGQLGWIKCRHRVELTCGGYTLDLVNFGIRIHTICKPSSAMAFEGRERTRYSKIKEAKLYATNGSHNTSCQPLLHQQASITTYFRRTCDNQCVTFQYDQALIGIHVCPPAKRPI